MQENMLISGQFVRITVPMVMHGVVSEDEKNTLLPPI